VTSVTGDAQRDANKGRVALDVTKSHRVEIDVVFDEDYTGPVEVYAVRGAA
jgi:hypothetical protein